MRIFALVTAAVIALPALASAQTYRAINNLNVVALGGSTFEVIEAAGEGPRGMWCAAADYAEKWLRTKGRIYIREGRGPARSVSGRKSVVFTTDAASLPKGPIQSLTISTSQVGAGLPVNHALQFCRFDEYELGSLGRRLR